ncbi:MAG: CoA transferase [Proteobacteria bacterium]|nr:CoA transferase [Pseudomonadota bacterium]MCP4919106.1 CoA transferase [Pseudomonadota bacterium]
MTRPDGPLTGLRIVDVSRLLPGPFCSWYLSSLGAEVIRLEPPRSSDYTWNLPPLVQGRSVFFAAVNRGKKSVALDVRQTAGREAFHTLLGSADVLLEGFKPGSMAAIGLAPKDLVERHGHLVVCSLSGYGQTGPLALEPGHDLNYLGIAGIVAADGRPAPHPVQIADLAGGALTAALSICAALVGRDRGAGSRLLDVSMAEGAMALLAPHLASAQAEQRALRPQGEMLTGGLANYRSYRCSDDRWITVGPIEPKFWGHLLGQLDEPVEPTVESITALFATATRDEWVAKLQACCVGPALEAPEVPAHPQHVARGAFEDVIGVPMARAPFPWATSTEVPALGAHTRAILGPLGVDVDALITAGLAKEIA